MSALPDRLQDAIGDTYRIEKELGGGGMSRVFLAEETRLGRKVVIKVLPPEMGAGVNVERFEREIRLAAKLQHPHIVPLLTAGSHDDLLYYVMPYIEGESLRAKLRGRVSSRWRRACVCCATSPTRCRTRTGTASYTATSSQTMCCSPVATLWSRTSVWQRP